MVRPARGERRRGRWDGTVHGEDEPDTASASDGQVSNYVLGITVGTLIFVVAITLAA